MENKWQTLQVIYELGKLDNYPTKSIIQTNMIIARLNFPWDEIVQHLTELEADGLLILTQLSTAVVSLTDKGIQHFASQSEITS